MGLDVLRVSDAGLSGSGPAAAPALAGHGDAVPAPGCSGAAVTTAVPRGLARAAYGVDLAPLLATLGLPRDADSRRAFWRALRPLRKAARTA
ncbi:MAG TPA: hypothetical protein VIG88_04945 [Lysobacter sp.]